MKKVLLLYSELYGQNLDLSVIADLLKNVLNEKSIECEIKVCNHLIADKKKLEDYDIIAGYHLEYYLFKIVFKRMFIKNFCLVKSL